MPCLYYILTYISLKTNSVSCGNFQSLNFTSVYQKKEKLKIYAQNIKHSKYPRYLDDFPKTSDFIHIFPPFLYKIKLCRIVLRLIRTTLFWFPCINHVQLVI